MTLIFAPHEREQTRALTRAFLARFFENEITSGTDDLKTSFFWLLSFLAVPGLFMPMTMAFTWQLVAMMKGPEVLRVLTRGDKAFYLGFVMIATASITAIAWNSLLADRRDGLVLGVLPVRPLVIVAMLLAAVMVTVFGQGQPDLARLSLVAGIAGMCTNAAIVGLYAMVAQSYPTAVRAGGTGFIIGVGRGGAALSPILAGFLFKRGIGLPTVAIVMALGSLIAAAALLTLRYREQHTAA